MVNTNTSKAWNKYLEYGERQFFKRNDIIYKESTNSENGFYFLKRGLIKISSTVHSGEERIIDIVDSDKLFGEQATDGDEYFSTAKAMKNCIIYYFSEDKIANIMEKDDNFKMIIFNDLTEKLKTLSNNLLFHSLPSEVILARSILILRDKFQSINIPFTQQELCLYTDLNRVTVYKVFKKWNNNVATLENKKVAIKNITLLEEIADFR